MTQLSNVPMQPSAVERPMTLIEKLEQLSDEYLNQYTAYGDNADLNCSSAVDDAIAIVKQHQTWRKMPSHEKPQDMQAYNLLLKTDSTEYPTLYSVGLFREYKSGNVWLSLVEAETYIDESDILAWQPISVPSDEFFESLEQPPSEVQE